ncbi:MAG: ABC transporter ATP-binding protein [Tannerellaceae bacterium]|jgi:iron complex transport system ATP-binding protein|nr:ABC transporter ATP-binding protein [Tannerellaceae bacterium]
MKPEAPILQTHKLSIGYAGNTLFEDLNLELSSGTITCLLGLNGSGKSTLLRTLCGLQPAISGQIKLFDKPLRQYSPQALARTVGVVLTQKRYAADLRAYDLVALGRHPHTGFFGALKQADKDVIEQSLEAVGMTSSAARRLAEMSDGERQKIMIAKAIAQQCPIILLDEPTAFLDVISRIETMMLLRKLSREHRKTILLSTHDLEQAIRTVDSFWMLRRGSQAVCGTPEDLILGGAMASLFEKNGQTFDPLSEHRVIEEDARPVGVEGDPSIVIWVNNALIRSGRKPFPMAAAYPCINCISPSKFIITHPNGICRNVASVSELLTALQEAESQPMPQIQIQSQYA